MHEITNAVIYVSRDVDALYPHQAFDEGQSIAIGKIKLSAINTPGHSPDGISILLEHDGKQTAIFTGDTLFIGSCGRPDLRERSGNIRATSIDLAKSMYHSLREKLMKLDDDVVIYPAHGAGTLCGKNLSPDASSTMAKEKQTNWSLQPATEEEFVKQLLSDQPFVPQYFPFDVALNRKGAAAMQTNLDKVICSCADRSAIATTLDPKLWVIDTRTASEFKKGHLPHAINLMENGKFETWLGSIMAPGEKFYLVAESKSQILRMLHRTAAIGYETSVAAALPTADGGVEEPAIDVELFRKHPENYTIVDVRNLAEVKAEKIFENSLAIPLAELRERVHEIPVGKPIVVHCAGGYRSAAAS